MFRRLTALAAAIGLGVAGLVIATPTTAHAGDYCDWEDNSHPLIESYSPSTVTVGLTSKLVKFNVRAYDDCGIQDWDVYSEKTGVWAYKSNPSERISPWSNAYAGTTHIDVEARDTNWNTTVERHSFTLLRATYWSKFNAGPEPIKKGKYLRITGTLKRADWDRGEYRSYGAKSQKAQIQFRAKNSSTYRTIKTVKLNSKSAVDTKIKISGSVARDGYYRVYFGGNGVSGTATATGDYVDVR